MADPATLPLEEVTNNRRKKRKSRRALKDLTTNEVNISAGKTTSGAGKEKGVGIAVVLSPKRSGAAPKSKAAVVPARSFVDDLEELQARLDQLRLEKEKTDEMLKERDEMLKQKEEELENRGKEQERLQKELKKLQKLKEFKPTVSLSIFQSLREKEQEKKDTKKKKKNKDCAEKRKPCPAYVLWCKDHWNQVKKENPSAEFKDISNILGAKWKDISAEEKKPYEEKYQQDKEAYLQVVGQEKRENEAMKLLEEEQMQKTAMELLEQYLQFRQETEKNKKTRKEKDPLKPKQPMSAFFLFTKERRAVLLEQTKNVLEISKIAGEEWKKMTEKKRAPYEEMARKQKEEYLQEMELYKQKKVEEAENVKKEEEEQKKILKQEALQMLEKKVKTDSIMNILKRAPYEEKAKETRRNKKNSDTNKPKKPASSFILFSKEARCSLLKERPGVDNSTLSALISVKWKELSETERKVWNENAAEAMQVYKKEMEEYSKSSVAPPENNTTATSR